MSEGFLEGHVGHRIREKPEVSVLRDMKSPVCWKTEHCGLHQGRKSFHAWGRNSPPHITGLIYNI